MLIANNSAFVGIQNPKLFLKFQSLPVSFTLNLEGGGGGVKRLALSITKGRILFQCGSKAWVYAGGVGICFTKKYQDH